MSYKDLLVVLDTDASAQRNRPAMDWRQQVWRSRTFPMLSCWISNCPQSRG